VEEDLEREKIERKEMVNSSQHYSYKNGNGRDKFISSSTLPLE